MALPEPEPGLVIRYSFLWSHEKAAGLAQGTKFRPSLVLFAKRTEDHGPCTVAVLPITHLEPSVPGIEHLPIGEEERVAIGLDAEPQWFVLNEYNRFIWPGRGIGFIPGAPQQHYGYLPRETFERVKRAIEQMNTERKRLGTPKISLIGRV